MSGLLPDFLAQCATGPRFPPLLCARSIGCGILRADKFTAPATWRMTLRGEPDHCGNEGYKHCENPRVHYITGWNLQESTSDTSRKVSSRAEFSLPAVDGPGRMYGKFIRMRNNESIRQAFSPQQFRKI